MAKYSPVSKIENEHEKLSDIEFLVTDFYGCIDVQRNEKGGKYDRREESLPDLGCNKREGKADRGQRNFSHILVLVGPVLQCPLSRVGVWHGVCLWCLVLRSLLFIFLTQNEIINEN
jgi:hypothetical protein